MGFSMHHIISRVAIDVEFVRSSRMTDLSDLVMTINEESDLYKLLHDDHL